MQKNNFLIWKNKKIPKVPSSGSDTKMPDDATSVSSLTVWNIIFLPPNSSDFELERQSWLSREKKLKLIRVSWRTQLYTATILDWQSVNVLSRWPSTPSFTPGPCRTPWPCSSSTRTLTWTATSTQSVCLTYGSKSSFLVSKTRSDN